MAKKRIEILTEVDKINLESNINKKANTTDVTSQLGKKVDKVSGKGLSTNDFTDIQKNKVDTEFPASIKKLQEDVAAAGKVDTVNSVKPDSQKNIELTGSDIQYKTGASENIGVKIDILDKDKWGKEELVIGGRNYIVDSKFNHSNGGFQIQSTYGSLSKDGSTLVWTAATNLQAQRFEWSGVLKQGDYIISMDIKNPYSSLDFKNHINAEGRLTIKNKNDDFFRAMFEFTVPTSGNVVLNFYMSEMNPGDTAYIRLPKLEKGNIPTDWTPAPEDILGELDTVKQSGVEINTLIVDELNSLGIVSSTNDSIEVNINKLIKHINMDDTSSSPGNKYIQIGNSVEGYYGAVLSSQLISGSQLANKIGITEGVSQHSDTVWHKFSFRNKTLFIPQKTIRHSITYSHLLSKKAVFGDSVISINGVDYKVRLLHGANQNPFNDESEIRDAIGSEWNRLLMPLSEKRKTGEWHTPSRVDNNLQDWKLYLTDESLSVGGSKDGRTGIRSWCVETAKSDNNKKAVRGNNDLSHLDKEHRDIDFSSIVKEFYGWRPVLEVIE